MAFSFVLVLCFAFGVSLESGLFVSVTLETRCKTAFLFQRLFVLALLCILYAVKETVWAAGLQALHAG